MKNYFTVLIFIVVVACDSTGQSPSASSTAEQPLAQTTPNLAGLWRGVLASPGGELPFGLQLTKTSDHYQAKILNGPEQVDTSAVVLNGNQIEIQFSWYDARITATVGEHGELMQGVWLKTAPNNTVSLLPFSATRGYPYRFEPQDTVQMAAQLGGVWQVEFSDDDGVTVAVGEFKQSGHKLNGTFLTPTGDYRYLAGDVLGNRLRLSAFDGAHAFLFDAHLGNGQLQGNFWSRDSYHATWVAQRNEEAYKVLPDSWEMVNVTTEDRGIDFAFEDINGQLVQLSDERFKNKAVIVNIFGTWCPNCNDEAPVLAEFYRKYHEKGLEIVGLAFEYTDDVARDKRQLGTFKKRHGIEYPLLRAGQNDKAEAAEILGFVDKIVAYPTSIFLNRNHQVVNIHSGFAGPGTGNHYLKLVHELEQQIIELIQ
ncbi:MAG: TlpA disulfide reductase family protein [Marinicella sp.]